MLNIDAIALSNIMLAYANADVKEESMSKIAIVYWSGTGNTQSMAEAVKAGAEAAHLALNLDGRELTRTLKGMGVAMA